MIEFHEVSKIYGDFTAVRKLALTVDNGEVFGFLGPNGAGKTTTIRMMMGIVVPSDGPRLGRGFFLCAEEGTGGSSDNAIPVKSR